MQVFYSAEVLEFVERISKQDNARLTRTRKFFEEYGFGIGPKYIKKITSSGIWELRAGRIRLFLFIRGDSAIGVHIIYKRAQKLPKSDIKLAERRSRDYEKT